MRSVGLSVAYFPLIFTTAVGNTEQIIQPRVWFLAFHLKASLQSKACSDKGKLKPPVCFLACQPHKTLPLLKLNPTYCQRVHRYATVSFNLKTQACFEVEFVFWANVFACFHQCLAACLCVCVCVLNMLYSGDRAVSFTETWGHSGCLIMMDPIWFV